MTIDYFGQRQAQVKAAQDKENEANRLRAETAAKMDREAREHLRDVIAPFFQAEAKKVASHGAYLDIKTEEVRGNALPFRLQVTLRAEQYEGSRSGWPVLIEVSPALSVSRVIKPTHPSHGAIGGQATKFEPIEIRARVAAQLDRESLAALYRTMVDEFFGH